MSLEKIGRYEIISELGKGAMGVVYKATDPNIGRTVALKTMRLDVHGMESDELLRRFKNEARAAGVLNHPNLVTIYDAGEIDGLFYIAMEFIEGVTLAEVLKEQRVLPVDRVIEIARQVCAGLDYAHGKGIIHRDIKPANIMIDTHGAAKIMDFGIAKGTGSGMTSTGQVLGTPNYMSPEQVRGKALDGRSDLFNLGVVLYECFTGERPFTGTNITTIIYKIVNERPPAPRDLDVTVHPGLSAVVMKALAKLPEERYASGAELMRDLQNYKELGLDTGATAVMSADAPTSTLSAAEIAPALASSSIRTGVQTGVAAASPDAVGWKAAASASGMQAAAAQPALQPGAAVQQPAPATVPLAPPAKKKSGAIVAIGAVAIVVLALGAYIATHRAKAPKPPETAVTTSAPAAPVDPASPATTQPSAATEPPATPPPAVSSPIEPAKSVEIPVKEAPAPAYGELRVTSTPDGAKVQIDGRSDSKWVTPFTASRLKTGTHSLSFNLDGYKPETLRTEVNGGKKSAASVQLQAVKAFIAVTSDPIGAHIMLDGNDTGQVTPARIAVDPGQHRMWVRKDGYRPQMTLADVGAGQTLDFGPKLKPLNDGSGAATAQNPADPQKSAQQGGNPFGRLRRFFGGSEDKGVLEVRTRPRGAEIWVGNNQVPLRTPTHFPLPPGPYKVTLRLKGFKPLTRQVQIEKGKTYGLEEILEPQ